MNKQFFIIASIILLAINIYVLALFQRYKLRVASYTQKSAIWQNELFVYKDNFTIGIQNSCINLYDRTFISDSFGHAISLKDFFPKETEHIIICRFKEMHCESCVESAIKILNEWADSVKNCNVLYLGEYNRKKLSKKQQDLYNQVGDSIFLADYIPIPVEEEGYPYYFILDSSLNVSNVFIPDKTNPTITMKYLDNIQKRFYEEDEIPKGI